MTIEFGRRFADLTEEEIKEFIMDRFGPKKITCFKKLRDGFRMKLYTEWESFGDNGEKECTTCADEIELHDPWEYGYDAIQCDFADSRDMLKLKQFCFAKGICAYAVDNPYIKETK